MKSFKIIWKSIVLVFLLFTVALILSIPATVSTYELGTRLTYSSWFKWGTDWSPNGKWITYSHNTMHQNGKYYYDVYIVPSKGGVSINLTGETPQGNCFFPKFTHDSQAVIFGNFSSGAYHIMRVDISQVAKSNPKPVTPTVVIDNATNGRWSHGGRYLVYSAMSPYSENPSWFEWDLRVYDSAKDISWSITPDPEGDKFYRPEWGTPVPSWSHNDSHVITFIGQNVGGPLLVSIPREGGSWEELCQGPYWSTDVSPNGKWILLGHDWYGGVFVLNTNTLEITTLIINTEGNKLSAFSPSFSPNGQQFCYVGNILNDAGKIDHEIFVSDFNPEVAKLAGNAESVPAGIALAQNSPNPFNPSTTISFTLATAGNTTVEVFNIAGQKVDTVLNAYLDAGAHSVTWNAMDRSAGLYFYTVKSGGVSKTMKMILAK